MLPWLTATQALNASGENRCGKYKSAYLRKPFTEEQINAMWAYLGNEKYTDYVNKQALIQVDSYGSAIHRPLHDTAVRQRDSIMKVQYQVYWTKQDVHEDTHLAWIRDTYKDAYAKLQEIKRHWDPLNVFRHAQSIRSGDPL